MSARLEGAAASFERWLSGLAGPELNNPPQGVAGAPGAAVDGDRCPVCQRPHDAPVHHQQFDDRYDEDFDYYWGDIRLPLWIALILQVPWRQRLDVFVIGFIIGLVVSGVAVLWGLLLSQY
jgi:hypothetical protein